MQLQVLRSLASHQLRSVLPQCFSKPGANSLQASRTNYPYSLESYEVTFFRSIILRTLSSSPQINHPGDVESNGLENGVETKEKMPLSLFFRQALGLSAKTEESEDEIEERESEIGELKLKLKRLEREVRRLKAMPKIRARPKNKPAKNAGVLKMENEPVDSLYALCKDHDVRDNSPSEGSNKLYALFANSKAFVRDKPKDALNRDERSTNKELSEDMIVFAKHLFKAGYMDDAYFLPGRRFDAGCFKNVYGRKFLKDAAEKFGKDNQGIAKWLSGSELKKVALFGCPSLAEKTVFAAKSLRAFFGIEEDNVCNRCALRQSCKFANNKTPDSDAMNLVLADVMKVVVSYGLESQPPVLSVPDEVMISVNRLLKEVAGLSQTLS